MNDELNTRAPAQPEPAAPTPDTFMGEPVLTRWKPLNRDDSRLALHQSMHNRSFGNPSDDKLMLEWLWENGYALCKRVPDEAAPTPQQQALDRMVENAETLGLYEAAPTEATLDQMANTAWDRFQRHTAELQALENCRLYAARHRKEDWAATILRFCADGGATGSPLREAAPTVVEPAPLTWKPILPGDGLPEWRVVDGGKRINSEDFHFDAALSVHGDFGSDQERQQYAEILAAKLNAATSLQAPAVEPKPVAWANAASLASAKVSRERGGPFDTHTWSENKTQHHDTPLFLAAHPPRTALTDEQAEALIESSDGRWHEDEFRIDSRDLMALLRKAHGIAASEGERK